MAFTELDQRPQKSCDVMEARVKITVHSYILTVRAVLGRMAEGKIWLLYNFENFGGAVAFKKTSENIRENR